MTIRQIFERLAKREQPARIRAILGSIRVGIDAWKPGFLDKRIIVAINPGERTIVLTAEGSNPVQLTFDEIEAYLENGKPAADRDESPAGPAALDSAAATQKNQSIQSNEKN
jgi:hypothetical protein